MPGKNQGRRAVLSSTLKLMEKWPEACLYINLKRHSIGSDALLGAFKKPHVNNLSSFQFRQTTPFHSRVRVFAKLFAKAYR